MKSNKNIKNQSDSEEETNEEYLRKVNKKEIKLDNTANNFNIKQSKQYSMNLMLERGCIYIKIKKFLNLIVEADSENLNLFSPSDEKEKKLIMPIISGQSEMDLSNLESELNKSIKNKNTPIINSLLHTIINKKSNQLSTDKKQQYSLLYINSFLELKNFNECIRAINNTIDYTYDKQFLINLFYLSAKTKLQINGQLFSGYIDLIKANSLIFHIKNLKTENWEETEYDKLISKLNELNLQYEIKIEKEKNYINTIYFYGTSKVGILGKNTQIDKLIIFNEFKNKSIVSITCDDHSVFIIFKNCNCINGFFDFIDCESNDCKNENLVFGWGENTIGQIDQSLKNQLFFDKPYIIPFFMGKNIQKISSYKNSYVAYDDLGNIYHWGPNQEIGVIFNSNSKIIDISKGSSFIIYLTNDNEVFFYGILSNNILNSEKPIKIFSSSKIISISAGHSHILCLSNDNKLYGIGSNLNGQLGNPENTPSLNSLTIIEIVSNMKIKQIKCLDNCSLIVNFDGELNYFGLLSKNKDKIANVPIQCDFPNEDKIINIDGNGNIIYAVNSKGQVLYWDCDNQVKFKFIDGLKNESFSDIFIGKNFQIFKKNLIVHNNCFVNLDKNSNLETFININIKINLFDEKGPFLINQFFQIRYFFYFSIEKEQDIKNLENLCQDLIKNKKQLLQEKNIYFEEILANRLIKLKLIENPGCHNFEFYTEKSGIYYLYVFLNEKLLKNCPLKFEIEKSSLEEEKKNVENDLIEKAEIIKKNKEEKQRLNELNVQKEAENLEKKQKITDKRAEETLKKEIKDKTINNLQEQKDKKNKAELITGGGYDLSKMKSNNKNIKKK